LAPTANLSNGTVTGNALTCSVTTAWQLFSASFTLGANTKNIAPIIFTDSQFSANDTLSIAQAGLHYGSSLRDWIEGDPIEEYLRCARFYEKSYDLDVAPATGSVAGFEFSPMTALVANNGRFGATKFRAVKRSSSPTVTVYSYTSGTVGAASNAGGTDQAANSGSTQLINAANFGTIQCRPCPIQPECINHYKDFCMSAPVLLREAINAIRVAEE
jgi:hypothetical protein